MKKIMINLLNEKSLPMLDLVGKVSLPEIFLIMKKSKLFIGNDSGLMHLSALANIPTIGLFGPSDSKSIIHGEVKLLRLRVRSLLNS